MSGQGYTYSGSNDVNAVAWYDSNSSGGTKAVGTKQPNELGIYDMSGNVNEFCEDEGSSSDAYPGHPYRRIRGGCWDDGSPFYNLKVYGGLAFYLPLHRSSSQAYGFRLARSSGN